MNPVSAVSAVRPDPRSFMRLTLAEPPRAARPVAGLVTFVVHAAALLLVSVNLAAPAPPPRPPEPEPILVRLPRPAAPPAPRAEAPKPKPLAKKPPVVRPPIVQPPIVPPEPEPEPEPEPDADSEATEGETTEAPASAAEVAGTGRPGGVVGGIGDAPLELRAVARPPTLIERVTPEYPRAARADHIEGLVLLRAVIGRDGRVERDQIRVVRSVPALDAAAVAALGGWRFTPAVDHQGHAVRVVVEIPFEFTLS